MDWRTVIVWRRRSGLVFEYFFETDCLAGIFFGFVFEGRQFPEQMVQKSLGALPISPTCRINVGTARGCIGRSDRRRGNRYGASG